jgi:Tfp pilus assembly protein PilN
MITVNLKPGARRQAAKGPAFGGVKDRFKALGQSIKQPWLATAIGVWAVVLLGLGFMWWRTSSQLGTLDPKLQTTMTEYRRYRDFLNQKKRAMRLQDSILAQIGTISAVDQDRYVWSHVMDEVAGALPDNTWLTAVNTVPVAPDPNAPAGAAPPIVLQIIGRTTDLQNYTAFLRRLDESAWLTNVLPIEAKTVIEGNRPLTAFTIQASYSRPDSTWFEMVPILESTGR